MSLVEFALRDDKELTIDAKLQGNLHAYTPPIASSIIENSSGMRNSTTQKPHCTGHSGFIQGLCNNYEIDVVNGCLSLLKKNKINPLYTIGDKSFVGNADFRCQGCPFAISFGDKYYCQSKPHIMSYASDHIIELFQDSHGRLEAINARRTQISHLEHNAA